MKHLCKSLTNSSLSCNKELISRNVISTSLFQKLKYNISIFFFLCYSALSWGLDSAKYNLTSDTSTLVALSSGTKIGLPAPPCPTFASIITIGGSTVPGSSYSTLTEAIADLSASGITQPVIFELSSTYTSASETFPLVLPSISGANATNTITIRPSSGATGRSITSTNALTTIDINGGNYWIIDGRKGGTGTADLAITNTNPLTPSSVSSAIRFINDASNNSLKYCSVTSRAGSTVSGVVVFSTTTGTTGNDNNTIDNCYLNGGDYSSNVIYAAGTTTSTATNNSGNTISSCIIYDFYSVDSQSWNGILLASGNTDWNIIGNSFRSTHTMYVIPNNLNYTAIRIINTSSGNNFVITDNIIGGLDGSPWRIEGTDYNMIFRAIWLSVGSTTASSIQNNTIKNIEIETGTTDNRQCLIYLQAGSINCGTITGNTINNISYTLSTTNTNATNITNSTNAFSVILAAGTPVVMNISNNSIGGITVSNNSTGNINLRGIHTQGPNTIQSYTISNNIIGSSSTASSIINSTNGLTIGINSLTDCTNNTISNNLIANLSNTHTGAASQLIGISLPGGTSGKFTVSGNTIRNLSNAGANLGTNASASIIGISLTAATTAGQTLSQNTIYELSNTNSGGVATGVIGIHYSGPASGTNIIEKNSVYGISTSGTSASGFNYGINVSAGTSRFQNNMISVGSGNNGVNIRGINDIAGTNNYYHNTVYIGGAPTANAANTFAFNSAVTLNTRAFQNNIFFNARSNNGSTGKHYAIALAGTAANPSGLTSNYNVFQATGSGGVLGLFNAVDRTSLSAWQTATGQDANSMNFSPVFVSTTDLHLDPLSNCNTSIKGTFIATVTTDIDGATRSNPPDIGADEFSARTWLGTTNNLWSVGANWSCGVVPTSTDAIYISSGTPTLDVDFSVDLTGTLTINGTGTLTVASGKTLTVAGTADFGGKSVVLKSDNSGTAAIGQITGTISGATNVKVERYLPAKRGWRLLTAPLKGSSSNTVASNWQGTANEGLLLFSPATYQTQTMTGYATGGGSPNIWKFNSTSNQWQSIPNISSESLFTSTVNNGFLVFATGPSNSSNIASGSTATTLKPVGQLITGSVNYSLTANKYHLIGNPYASPLNTEVMVQAHANSKVYMMDPSLSTMGGYTVYDGTNWTPSTPSGSDKYIQSGQGFILKSTSGGTFTIAETHKVSGNTNTWFVRTATETSVDKIRVLLYKQNNNDWQLADGILAVNSASGNHDVDAVDTDKMTNFNENILFKNGTSNLSIEYRGLPSAGTFQPMHVTGTTAQSYELRLKTENYSNSNFMPYLENTQTGALTAIPTDGSELIVPFMGIGATSSTPDTRFRIVYQSALNLEETDSLEVLVYPNPINEGLFTVVLPQTNLSANYSLTNILGQEVQKGTLLALSNSIQVQQLTSGVYLLQVNQEGKRFTTKLIIN
jgi:hypothetical protein